MAMSPGQYLRKRREAAELTLDDVALRIETVPTIAASARAAWLAQIEADILPVPDGFTDAILRPGVFSFDADVLEWLIDLYGSREGVEPRVCRGCGCTEFDPCVDAHSIGCAWADSSRMLCTACLPVDVEAAIAVPASSAGAAA